MSVVCAVEWRGREAYGHTWARQRELLEARAAGQVPDTLIFVEHEAVVTRGRKSRDLSNLLATGDLPVIEVERGGDVTYHGPGQLVAYPIFALAPDERDAPGFIRRLEGWLIDALAALGVEAARRQGYAGVWVGERKVASVGISVTARWVTWHGVALNLSVDLKEFARINPCGMDASVMTSLAELGRPATLEQARTALVHALPHALGRQVVRTWR